MHCQDCGSENVDGAKFCSSCGSRLILKCPSCSEPYESGAKFCSNCGTKVGDDSTSEQSADSTTLPYAERRQLTVVFSDLVDSTSLSERLDPEDLRDVLHDYQAACRQVISLYDGYLAKYLGDGVLAYFGYPSAHEDDASRAVRAGLGIVEAIQGMSERFNKKHGLELAVRVGVHTGLVVVGDMDTDANLESDAIVGQTPNFAARIQTIADSDSVVISKETMRLVEGFFECQNLGEYELKGISGQRELFRVLHESTARSRLDVLADNMTPLVGRDKELSTMMKSWHRAEEGESQAILVGGEAGVGKSRLLVAFKERVGNDPEAWLTELRCSPYHQNSAFWPVIDFLTNTVLKFHADESDNVRLAKIEGFVSQYGLDLKEHVPLLASFFGVSTGPEYAVEQGTAQKQRAETMKTLVAVLEARAKRQPVLFVVEDLHWADPSTLELMDMLLASETECSLLSVLSYRPAFQPYWKLTDKFLRLDLTGLEASTGEAIVRRVAGGKKMPQEATRFIMEKTDGIPLYVEELTRSLIESTAIEEGETEYRLVAPLDSVGVPSSLQDSLTARLDKLGDAKPVAQMAATLGREFSYNMLNAIPGPHRNGLESKLDHIVKSGLAYQKGIPPTSTYMFKHALVQDAAYESLLRTSRQEYHGQIADTLSSNPPADISVTPELLALHYAHSKTREKAIEYLLEAAQRAIANSANAEAINHANKGLEILEASEAMSDAEKEHTELFLQTSLGLAQIALKGYAATEVEQTFARARELAQKVDESPVLFQVLWGLWAFYIVKSEFASAKELGEDLLEIAEREENEDFILEVQPVLGHNYFWTGDFEKARQHFQKGVDMYDVKRHSSHGATYMQDPCVVCLSYLSWIHWIIGDLDKATELSQRAIDTAVAIDQPYSLGYALSFAGVFHIFRREPERALQRSEEDLALSREQGFVIWEADADLVGGWAKWALGNREEGEKQYRQGFAMWQALGARLWRTQQLAILAEMKLERNDLEDAESLINESLEMSRSLGESHYVPELHRLSAEVHRRRNDVEGMKKSLETALTIAQDMNAAMYQLRVAVSIVENRESAGADLLAAATDTLESVLKTVENCEETSDVVAARSAVRTISTPAE